MKRKFKTLNYLSILLIVSFIFACSGIHSNKQVKVLIVGDSIMSSDLFTYEIKKNLEEQLDQEITINNISKVGNTPVKMLSYITNNVSYTNYNLIIILIGINGVGKIPLAVENNIERLVNLFSNSTVLLNTLLPLKEYKINGEFHKIANPFISKLNMYLKAEYIDSKNVVVLPIHDYFINKNKYYYDEIHLNRAGLKYLATVISRSGVWNKTIK